MGYELTIDSVDGPKIHEAIWSHPVSKENELKHVGSAAINSFRIERGFKLWADLDFVHYKEAGIEPFITKKRDFMGKDVEGAYKPTKKSVMFQIDSPKEWEYSCVGDTPIYLKE